MIDNPPAFPVHPRTNPGEPGHERWTGMTLRDYFAAQALGGLFAAEDGPLPDGTTLAQYRAAMCAVLYDWADAMLAERAKVRS